MDLLLAINGISAVFPSGADVERNPGSDDPPVTASRIEKRTGEVEDQNALDVTTEPGCAEMLDEQVIEAGALLILACMAGRSFARMWKPGMNDIPHSGSLPREEVLLERNLPLEVDATFSVNGRPWLMLK